MVTKQQVEQLLLGLGSTPEDVADRLRAEGIKGDRDCGDSCPMANWLREKLPDAWDVNVQTSTVDVDVSDENGEDEYISVTPPHAVAEFVSQFDCGKFPELDAWPEDEEDEWDDYEDEDLEDDEEDE